MTIIEYLNSKSKQFHIILCSALLVLVGIGDYLTGAEISFSVFYLLPISLVAWFTDKWMGILFSTIAAIIWFFSDTLTGHLYSHFLIPYWNAFVRLCIFVIISYLLSKIKIYFMHDRMLSRTDSLIGLSNVGRNRIVVRYANDKVVKGYTYNFSPNRSSFHIELISGGNEGKGIEVALKDIKGVFFVRDFTGDASYNERKYFEDGQEVNGRKVEVSFKDGEVLVGSIAVYDPNKQGFFFYPADPQSNNLKIFVMLSAVSEVDFLQ